MADVLFKLRDISCTPVTPKKKQAFTVTGKIELFSLPFLTPIWVIAKVTYPEKWWEEIIPIMGSPTVGEGQMALGGDFEILFAKGFDREGEFSLAVEAHLGPTYTLDSATLPPFPPLAKYETTFIVAGEVPPEELGFRDFRIVSYSKNGGSPVSPPAVLKLEVGDRCRVNLAFDHMDGAVTPKIHAAIGNLHTVSKWFDEVLSAEKTYSVPASSDWESWTGYIDIIITSDISAGTYSLYAKIIAITGGDIFTPDYENVVMIAGGVPTLKIVDIAANGGA